MGNKLYVGNIAFQASEDELTELFKTIGEVESVKIIIDMRTGQSRGFGFVEMASSDDAVKAISELNGTPFLEKNLIVNEARPQKPREKRGFGGGGGRGGYGSGRGKGRGSRSRRGRR